MEQLIGQVLNNQYRIMSLLGHQIGRRTFLADNIKTTSKVVIKLLGHQRGHRTFLADNVETTSQVVIKILLFSPEFTWADFKLFEREAETIKSLNHPHIPQYLDYFELETELGKGFALVQSYIEAKSLQNWMESGRTFNEEDIKYIAKQLLNILNYLHQLQPPVIHRDIKPSNILLSDRSGHSAGQVYLVDFGSVQTIAHGGTKTIVGTYGYMPPEQFGDRCVPASDLYAVGATLIYLATGYPPSELPQKEMRLLFKDKANLSANLVDWLQWLTEPSLDLRLKSAQNALEALEKPRFQENNLMTFSQPPGSNIRLTQTAEMIDILIPPPPFKVVKEYFMDIIIIIPVWGVCVIIVDYIVSLIPLFFSYKMAMYFFSVVLFFSSIGDAIDKIFNNFFTTTRLTITSSEIVVAAKVFGFFCYDRFRYPRKSIVRLEQIALSYKEDSNRKRNKKDSNRKRIKELNIWTGSDKFSFGENLSDTELTWLARNLSDWLELPITKN
ncbi:MAG: serine/threonine protein kinase [Crocosphaera sp.]